MDCKEFDKQMAKKYVRKIYVSFFRKKRKRKKENNKNHTEMKKCFTIVFRKKKKPGTQEMKTLFSPAAVESCQKLRQLLCYKKTPSRYNFRHHDNDNDNDVCCANNDEC